MMRKRISTILTIIAILISIPGYIMPVSATENTPVTAESCQAEAPSYFFELSVDGKDTKEVEKGDIITVVLKLKRTDSAEAYTMYAMQDEIRYDSTFLEVVEGSAVLGNGIGSTDMAMVDQYREFYMNYLSMRGGEKWEADTLIGSIQLRVIGESGVTKITSQDYLVSLQDGSGSYECEANDVTIILSTDCVVTFRTNGGSELEELIVQFGEKVSRPEDPVREGYKLEGWYTDIHMTEEWYFDEDTVAGNMSLYAKWTAETTVMETENECHWLWLVILIALLIIFFILIIWHRKKEEE